MRSIGCLLSIPPYSYRVRAFIMYTFVGKNMSDWKKLSANEFRRLVVCCLLRDKMLENSAFGGHGLLTLLEYHQQKSKTLRFLVAVPSVNHSLAAICQQKFERTTCGYMHHQPKVLLSYPQKSPTTKNSYTIKSVNITA